MAEDYNINIRNGMGGGGKTASQMKLSTKGSINRAKNTMQSTGLLKKATSGVNSTMSAINSGSSTGILSSKIGKIGSAGAAIGMLLATSEKLISFGINLQEAETGNRITAHNSRNTLKTVSSLGMNYVYGAIQNELFTKRQISRQNYSLDYGRELYGINVEGTKNKRI
ncbi:MAG: hypothetical protein M0R51_10935 [Clostridia bacterium]|jgi:hypothetical protein|nr:hypothetical protein [Clostridia bacterium]